MDLSPVGRYTGSTPGGAGTESGPAMLIDTTGYHLAGTPAQAPAPRRFPLGGPPDLFSAMPPTERFSAGVLAGLRGNHEAAVRVPRA